VRRIVCALLLAAAPGWALAQGVLRLFNWNNYITEASVKAFEAQCRCRLAQDYYSDNEEMLAKLAAGATGYDLIVYSLSAALDLTLAFILVPKFGIEGAAAAQAITIAASNWLRLVLVRRFVGIFPWDGAYARLAIPSAVCAIAMFGAQKVLGVAPWYERLVVVGLVGAIVYLPALLLFALTPQERVALRNGVSKLRDR